LEHPQVQLPNFGALQQLEQSIKWATPGREIWRKGKPPGYIPPSIAEEVQSLGGRFDHLSSRILEHDQTFNQVKGDLRRLYQDNGDAKQHQGEVTDMVKRQQGEISILRTENGRSVQALREILNGLTFQMENIQSQSFKRGAEGGTLNQEVGDELKTLVARVRDLEATMEVIKTDFNAIFCSLQNLQQDPI
jgi:hypothetical protein